MHSPAGIGGFEYPLHAPGAQARGSRSGRLLVSDGPHAKKFAHDCRRVPLGKHDGSMLPHLRSSPTLRVHAPAVVRSSARMAAAEKAQKAQQERAGWVY
jgi:hypothetical protein